MTSTATADRAQAELARTLDLQTVAARQRRIEKAARRDPATQELLEDHNALRATLKLVQEKHAALEQQHANLAAEASRLAEEKIRGEKDLAIAEGILSQIRAALPPEFEGTQTVLAVKQIVALSVATAAELAAAQSAAAESAKDAEAARSDAAKLRAQLAKARDQKA